MADSAATDAAAAVSKLHLDEVTGEMISKTELKKRQKTREREAQKKEKQATKAQSQPAKEAKPSLKDAEAGESELTPNQVRSCGFQEAYCLVSWFPVANPICSAGV